MPESPYAPLWKAVQDAMDTMEDVSPDWKLGKAVKPFFSISSENRSLNYGSFGNPPLTSVAARIYHLLAIDRDTDVFMRTQLFDELDKAREELEDLIHLNRNQGEVVFLDNAGSCINCVIQCLVFNPQYHLARAQEILERQSDAKTTGIFEPSSPVVKTENAPKLGESGDSASGSATKLAPTPQLPAQFIPFPRSPGKIKVLKMVNAYPSVHTSLEKGLAQHSSLQQLTRLLAGQSGNRAAADAVVDIEVVVCSLTTACFDTDEGLADEIVTTALTGRSTEDRVRSEGAIVPAAPCDIIIIDHVCCAPAVIVPVQTISQRIRAKLPTAIILVDAAHAVGQIPVDMSDPSWTVNGPEGELISSGSKTGSDGSGDQREGALCVDAYWSNCHKWLMTPKSTAMMVLSNRVRPFMHPPVIANFYRGEEFVPKGTTGPTTSSSANPSLTTSATEAEESKEGGADIGPKRAEDKASSGGKSLRRQRLEEFLWQGTRDFCNELTIRPTLEFRRRLGGEDRITSYCRDTCWEGANFIANIWGSTLLFKQKERNASIIQVVCPAKCQQRPNLTFAVCRKLMMEYNTFAVIALADVNDTTGIVGGCNTTPKTLPKSQPSPSGGRYLATVRVSCQVYNDLTDFEYFAKSFLAVMEELDALPTLDEGLF